MIKKEESETERKTRKWKRFFSPPFAGLNQVDCLTMANHMESFMDKVKSEMRHRNRGRAV